MPKTIAICIITNKITEILKELLSVLTAADFEIFIGLNGMPLESFEKEITKNEKIKIFELEWEGYGATKNKLAGLANCNWILSLDADEIPDDTLLNDIKNLDLENESIVYLLKRIQKIGIHSVRFGSYGMEEWKPRLYHRNFASWNNDKVHEELVFEKNIKPQQLPGTLWHYTANSIQEIKEKNEHYALLSAQQMAEKGRKYTFFKPYFSGITAFFKQYFIKKGFLDGAIGYRLAFEIARYSFNKYYFLKRFSKK